MNWFIQKQEVGIIMFLAGVGFIILESAWWIQFKLQEPDLFVYIVGLLGLYLLLSGLASMVTKD